MFNKENVSKVGNTFLMLGIISAILGRVSVLPFHTIIANATTALFSISVCFYILSGFVSSKKKQKQNKLIKRLQEAFGSSNTIRLSGNVIIKKEKDIDKLTDVVIYYGEDRVCTIKDYVKYSRDEYDRLIKELNHIEIKEDFIDEDNNGIDDREERRAQYFMDEIKVLSNKIQHDRIHSGLEEVIKQLKDIRYLETRYDNVLPKLGKLYERYLPILMSILNTYIQLLYTNTSSEEIAYMEEKLMKTIILVNEALLSIKTDLVKDDILNLSTDMSVLEMVLKQDGLIEDGLTMPSRKE